MILTVTLNPLLERRLTYPQISFGSVNRNGKLQMQSGGKGINISRQLNNFNVDNLAVTFTGGANGRVFSELLHKEKIKLVSVRTKAETRGASVIIDESQNRVTTFFEESPEITEEEADEFSSRLEKMIPNYEMIVFSGSSPCTVTDHIFPEAIQTANKLDKISILDTYGNHYGNCINAGPTIIHNNLDEIRTSTNINLYEENEIIKYLRFLYSRGIKQAYLTDGANIFYSSNFDYHFKILPPQIKEMDSTGSGDAFTAGIIYSWQQNFTYQHTLTFAAICGALNACSTDVCNVKINDVEKVAKEVEIYPIGKKMKLLDVNSQ